MEERDDIDLLLSAGSERPEGGVECVDEGAIDHGHLLAYRNGALSEELVSQVEKHLIDCAYCRDLLAELSVTPRASRGVWSRIAVAVAACLLVGVLLSQINRVAPVGPYELTMAEGWDLKMRGPEEPVPEKKIFRPHSQVKLKLEPKAAGHPADHVVLFVSTNGGPLVAVPNEAMVKGEGGVFLVKTSGRKLFGDAPGQKTLFAVASAQPVSGLAGKRFTEIEQSKAVSWLKLFDAQYVVK